MKKTRSISEIKSEWIKLDDLERGGAVRDLQESGIHTRQIAAQLQRSESSLRRIVKMLDAPVEDKILFRQGRITGNELLRRSKAAGIRCAAQHREEIELERARQTLKAVDRICDWLVQEAIPGSYAELVISRVRDEVAERSRKGIMPKAPKDKEILFDVLVERSKPKGPMPNDAELIDWYKEWLCRWSFFAFPDEEVRDTALELALQKQWAR